MANRPLQTSYQGALILLILLVLLIGPAKACTPGEYRDLAGWKAQLAARRAKLDEVRPLIFAAKARAQVFRDTAASAALAGAVVDTIFDVKTQLKHIAEHRYVKEATTDFEGAVYQKAISAEDLESIHQLSREMATDTTDLIDKLKDIPSSPGDVFDLAARGALDWLDRRSFEYAAKMDARLNMELRVLIQAASWIREYEGYCAEEEAEARQSAARPAPTPPATPAAPVANTKPVDLRALDRMAGAQSLGTSALRPSIPSPVAPTRPALPATAPSASATPSHGQREVVRPRLPPSRPSSSQFDLGALDRMTPNAAIAPARPQRPISQEAYLAACLGREASPECHRVHCLHVGAELNDPQWTQDCLNKR